eukprot:jgi/Tetstr1/421089/TSEL_012133.t1
MTGGKKAAATKKTPADSLDETPAEPTEPTRDNGCVTTSVGVEDHVDALDLLDTAHRTLEGVGDADEARLTYLRRFKAEKALTHEEQVAERLIYSRVLDTAEHERSANVVDGLLAALEHKRLEVGLAAAAFKRRATERDTDCDKARKETKDREAHERWEQKCREADAKNRDKNGGKTGEKTRD